MRKRRGAQWVRVPRHRRGILPAAGMRINLPDHAEGTRRGGGRVWHAGSRALTAPTATAARPRRAPLCVQCRQPGAAVWGDRVAGTWWRQRCHPVSPRGRGEEGALDKINPDWRRSASASGLEGLVLSLVPHGSRRAREAARAQRPRPLPGCSPGPAHGPLGLPSPTQGSVSKHARAVPSVKTLRSRERLRSQGACRLQGRRSGTPSAPRPRALFGLLGAAVQNRVCLSTCSHLPQLDFNLRGVRRGGGGCRRQVALP